jgi:hypothetical protein
MNYFKKLVFSRLPEPLKNFLRLFKYWLKRLISSPMHLGSADYYPPVHYLDAMMPFTRHWSVAPKTRLKYWAKIAKAYPTFRHFYADDPVKSFEESSAYKQLQIYREPVYDLYNTGVGKIEKFLA